MIKPTKDMTADELVEESVQLNAKIAENRRQSYNERQIAWRKLHAPKRMKKGYLEAMKMLYGE